MAGIHVSWPLQMTSLKGGRRLYPGYSMARGHVVQIERGMKSEHIHEPKHGTLSRSLRTSPCRGNGASPLAG